MSDENGGNVVQDRIKDGECGGCSGESDPNIGGVDGVLEAHWREVPRRERGVPEVQEERSEP